MLVLSRKRHETIVIAGGEVVISIVEIRGDKVRIGIEAAKDISVHRGEVQAAIDRKPEDPV
jgi:carbon storage regulator